MKTRIVNVLACAVLLTALTDLAQAGETPTPPNDESALDPLYLKHLEEIGDPYLPPTHDPDLRSAGRSTWTVGNFTSVQVNVDQFGDNIPGDAANEPSIAVDPTNPNRMVIGWRQFDTIASNFRQSGWAYSHDGGLTWTFPGVLRPGEFASDPVLDSDLDGNFYYYSLQPGRGPGDWACYLYKSFDGGVTWPQDVYGWGGDKEWMVIDKTGGIGSGNVYTTWNVAFSCCTEDFARSVNGGLSFPAMEKMPLNIHWGTLSVGPDGELYVSGENFWVARSLSAQDPFAAPVFETWSFVDLGGDIGGVGGGDPNPGGLLGQAWVATDHSTGVNRGNVYLLCSVDVPGADPRDVMFSRSTDGGFTWSPPVRVNDVADGWQWFGTMSVAPNGRIDVVWNDTRNDPGGVLSELYYSYSLDAGQTWAPSEPASPVFDPLLGWPQQNKIGDYYHMVSDNLGAGLAYAATFNGEQDVYYLRIGTFDCNGNGVPDDEDITGATSDDCNSNAIPDECEPDEDCNTNGIQDICDIAGSTSYDCTLNGTPDECEPDCNDNAVADSCDIAGDTSDDCNQNRIPDDCDILDLDCNDNGTPDACDVETQDCNANNIPDDCDADYWDCNANNIPDDCDIALGTSDDCTQNGVPDECEPDCDGDDLADSCAIATGLGLDCNGNGAPDACDIDLGLSVDADTNGIPDECDAEACVALWDGFQPNPPFSRTKPLSLIDYNDDGIFWDNPEDTATIDRRGCETGASSDQTVRVDVDSGLADPTDGYVASETFITVDGGLDCGAAIYSLSFKPKVGLSIDSRWDWQLFVFDGKNDVPVIQLEFISLSSQRQEVVPGRILVRNPAPPPAARYLDTGIDITLDGCYDLEIVLDNVDHTVQLLVDGSPALAQTIAPLNSSALRMDHFQVVAVENLGQTTTLTNLKLDDFELCRNGLSTMTWLDCNDNCVDDAWDITNEVSRDCNHNEVPDECDLAGSTSTDTNNNRVPDECDGSQRGDFDNDGDIDRADYAAFRQCITGPGGGPVAGSCRAGDFDFDDDVDLGDFSWFQDDFDNGAGRGVLKGARTVSGSLSKR